MKAIILIPLLFLMGCDNQFSQDSTAGLSKECQLFNKLDNCEGSGCEGYFISIPLVGTKYEWIVDEVLKGWPPEVISAELKERYTEEEAIEITTEMKKIGQEWLANLPIPPPDLSPPKSRYKPGTVGHEMDMELNRERNKRANNTWLLRTRKHLNCPPPKKQDNL